MCVTGGNKNGERGLLQGPQRLLFFRDLCLSRASSSVPPLAAHSGHLNINTKGNRFVKPDTSVKASPHHLEAGQGTLRSSKSQLKKIQCSITVIAVTVSKH